MPFRDRTDAGRRLAALLGRHAASRPVVLALPRGGVTVAAEVADALDAPMDLVLVRKIGVPTHGELAMGAVADGETPVTVRNEDIIGLLQIDEATFEAARRQELVELERRRRVYLAGRPAAPVRGGVAIVVDDGVATGATTRAALRAVRARGPARVVLAVPVAPRETLEALREEADEIVCLEEMGPIGAIGAHYADFGQLSDADVQAALAQAP